MSTVSVIIPTYEREEPLIRAVESVLRQTYDDFELVIVDDHSQTPAADVLKNSGIDDSRIRVHRHDTNRGGNAARNTGIEVAIGDYLAFLDDDDEWLPEKLERQIGAMKRTDAEASYTGVEQLRNGSIVAIKKPNITGSITTDLLQRPFGGFSSLCILKTVFDQVDGPDNELPSWQEWDFYLRVSEYAEFTSVPDPLVRQHSHHGEQVSDNYETKRDITVQRFRKKHRKRAKSYGVLNDFEATIAAELGWAAISNGEYSDARQYFLRSLRYKISKRRMLIYLTLIGGKTSHNTAIFIKNKFFPGKKMKTI